MPQHIEDATLELPNLFGTLIARLLKHLQLLDRQVAEIEIQIRSWHRNHEATLRLEKIPGISPITATVMVATIGDAQNFNTGSQLAAWLGLIPHQHSSGGKQNLLGMSKRTNPLPVNQITPSPQTYCSNRPPSITIPAPLIILASSDAKNATVAATSSTPTT